MSEAAFQAHAKGFETIYAPLLEVVMPRADAYQVVFDQPPGGPVVQAALQGIPVVHAETGEQRNVTLFQGLSYVPVEFYDSLRDHKEFKALEALGAFKSNPPHLHQPVSAFNRGSVIKWAQLLWRSRREDDSAEAALRAYLPAIQTSDLRVAIMTWLEARAAESKYAAPPAAPVFAHSGTPGTAVAETAAELGLSLSYGARQV
jgi:hypothetical protein